MLRVFWEMGLYKSPTVVSIRTTNTGPHLVLIFLERSLFYHYNAFWPQDLKARFHLWKHCTMLSMRISQGSSNARGELKFQWGVPMANKTVRSLVEAGVKVPTWFLTSLNGPNVTLLQKTKNVEKRPFLGNFSSILLCFHTFRKFFIFLHDVAHTRP